MTRRLRGHGILLSVLFTFFAEAQPFDAVVSGENVYGCQILPLIIDSLEWVNPVRVESPTQVRALDSSDGRHVFAIVGVNPYQIAQIGPDGGQTAFYPGSGVGQMLAVAGNGRVFVLVNQLGAYRIDRISATGTLEASIPIAALPFAVGMDVASDGCTLFIAHGNSIARINGCTGAALPDFATVTLPLDVEVQPNGEVLITTETEVRLYSAAGALIRVVASMTDYGLNPLELRFMQAGVRDGDLWITAMNQCDPAESSLLRVRYASGQELARWPLTLSSTNSLVIGAATAGIPTLSEVVLTLLALTLGAAGSLVLRLR